jgi:3-dehydroquinate dehydratase II
MNILIINGPNLNMLGKREPEIYGSMSFEDYFLQLVDFFPNIKLEYFQSNHEGDIIDKLQVSIENFDAVIINPGGYTHTSVAIADAIRSINVPVYEVHISNIYSRESFRTQSFTAAACKGIISGFGLKGYKLAILAILHE